MYKIYTMILNLIIFQINLPFHLLYIVQMLILYLLLESLFIHMLFYINLYYHPNQIHKELDNLINGMIKYIINLSKFIHFSSYLLIYLILHHLIFIHYHLYIYKYIHFSIIKI